MAGAACAADKLQFILLGHACDSLAGWKRIPFNSTLFTWSRRVPREHALLVSRIILKALSLAASVYACKSI